MSHTAVNVFANGAVSLGAKVVCDGFAQGYPYRVQTHIHDDHMGEFGRSKGEQDLFLTPETHELLIAERDADLEFRENFHRVVRGTERVLDDGSKLFLVPSNHMLGACQVALELPDGLRIGYSSDFGWPLDAIIEVDKLVVDSTYGSPRRVRGYTQEEAEMRLYELVCERLRHGSVHIQAYRGTAERVLQVVGDSVGVPILASERLFREVEVYQKYGFACGRLDLLGSARGKAALEQRAYVRLYSKGDGFRNEHIEGTTITCSAFMVDVDNPLIKYSDRAYSVALSNHADFEETLEYVRKTRARWVVTDNTRNHGWELAMAINRRFANVNAEPSTNEPASPRWD